MNYIKSILMLFALSILMISCDEDDQIGHSQSIPTSPSVSINLGFTNPTLVEDDSEFEYTVTLSETQIVDVKLHVVQIGGTASADDYEMTGLISIPAGYTSATGTIKILSDELLEDTETLEISIGTNTTANASSTPATAEFTILNYTEGDLVVDLSWELSEATTDDSGEVIEATDFADMRLLLSTTPDSDGILDGADGGSFETFVLEGDLPDGDYYILADFYAANEDIVRDLNLDLEFNQVGTINHEAFSFPNAINNASICGANFFVLTKVIKSGTSYTFEIVNKNNFNNEARTWLGTDAGYDSQVKTGVDCSGITIAGLNAGWMVEFWGEVIIDSGVINYSVDDMGAVTIPNQFLYTTTWNGGVQPNYNIEGTGTLDLDAGTLNIQYSLIQGATDWAGTYGETDGYFHATLTLDN